MKKLLALFICVCAIIAICPAAVSAEETRTTMRGLTLYWDAYGWPEGIGYAERQPQAPTYEGETEYLRLGETESWTVGITCTEAEARAIIEPLLSAPCEFTFVPCAHTRTELRALLPEVVADYRLDLACGDIRIVRDSIWVYATSVPGLHELYVAAAEAKYGSAVTIKVKNGTHEDVLTFDQNGNDQPYIEDPITFEIFLLCAVALTAAAIVLGIVFRRRIRAAVKKKWLRALLPAAFILLLWGAEALTAAIAKPSAEHYYAEWLEPYNDQTRVVSLGKATGLEYDAAATEPSWEQLTIRIHERLLALCEPEPVTDRDVVREGDVVTLGWKSECESTADRQIGISLYADGGNAFTAPLIGAKLNEKLTYSYTAEGRTYSVEAVVTGLGAAPYSASDEFAAAVKAEYEAELTAQAPAKNIETVLKAVAATSQTIINRGDYQKRVEDMTQACRTEADARGVDFDEYVAAALHGSNVWETPALQMRTEAVAEALIEKYGLTADSGEVAALAAKKGIGEAELEDNPQLKSELSAEASYEKLGDWLLRKNRAKT